jgi:hypothetical protein
VVTWAFKPRFTSNRLDRVEPAHSHCNHDDIKRVYEADRKAGRVDGSLIACNIGGLSRFKSEDLDLIEGPNTRIERPALH